MPGPHRKTAQDTMNTSRAKQRQDAADEVARVVGTAGADDAAFTPPDADPKWHTIAKRFYSSLSESHQSVFYQPSDWSAAWLIAETISRELKPKVVGVHPVTGRSVIAEQPITGAAMSAILKGMSGLLVTQGDRLRAGLELPTRQESRVATPIDAQVMQMRMLRARQDSVSG